MKVKLHQLSAYSELSGFDSGLPIKLNKYTLQYSLMDFTVYDVDK